MAHALTIQRTTVPASERERYFERMRLCQIHYAAANCRFRVFEENALRGAFIEFVEADDEVILAAATANSPYKVLDPSRVYYEREIGENAG
jgi:DNA-binding XRE family transcriptional regulator